MPAASDRWAGITFPALYYIHTFTTVDRAGLTGLYRTCTDVIQGGCRLIQLRYKGPWSIQTGELLRLMIGDFEGSEARFLLNDQAEWAAAAAAHGVHVGEGDTPPAEARRLLGRAALIGVTAKTPAQEAQALAADVDYVAWGALFPSSTKPEAVPGALEEIPRFRARLRGNVKLCVIGGITEERLPQVFRHAGADLIAVGAAIQQAADPQLATLKLVDALRVLSAQA